MNGYGKLRAAIRAFELTKQSHERATEDFRQAVRDFLREHTTTPGSGRRLANKLGISSTQISNLKTGCQVASIERAQELLKVCEEMTKR